MTEAASSMMRAIEEYADRLILKSSLDKASSAFQLQMPYKDEMFSDVWVSIFRLTWETAWGKPGTGYCDVESVAFYLTNMAESDGRRQSWLEKCAHLLRDIFPTPSEPGTHPPNPSPELTTLARAAYDSADPLTGRLDNGLLAVLSDAAEEAGCHDVRLLNHLRGLKPCTRCPDTPGSGCAACDGGWVPDWRCRSESYDTALHVKGCWAVEALGGQPAGKRRKR